MRYTLLFAYIASAILPLANLQSLQGKTADEEGATPEKLLQKVQTSTDIRTTGSRPFRLTAAVKLFDEKGQTQDGTYRLLWQAPTVWQDELKFADFSQVRLASGEKLFVSRNPTALSLEVFHLLSLLEFPKSVRLTLEGATLKKLREVDTSGIREKAFEVISRDKSSRTVYFDESSSLPVRIEYQNESAAQFQDYAPFGDYQFPHTLLEQKWKKPFIQVHVQELEAASFAPTTFVPPVDAHSIRWCLNVTSGRLLPPYAPIPLPSSVAKKRVVIYGIIGTDGLWHDVQVVKSGGKEADAYWTKVLLKERFSPSTCGNEPVVQEVVVEFSGPELPGP